MRQNHIENIRMNSIQKTINWLTVLVFLFLQSCSGKAIDHGRTIDLNASKISFSDLPIKIKKIYELEIQKPFHNTVVSLDKEISISYKLTGMDDGIGTLITEGYNHHFYIKGKHFKLQANKGQPFVFSDSKLYYPLELNLYEDNFDKVDYMVIDLAEELE